MISGESNGTIEAPNGGQSTRNKLTLNITSQSDGSTYTCQATNKLLQLSVHDGVTLSVKYKPEFHTIPSDKFDILESGTTVINMNARANPASIVYVWLKDGVEIPQLSATENSVTTESGSRIASRGPELHVSNAKRSDGGHYTVKATNDEGSTVNKILLNVQYEANVTGITSSVMVYEEEDASFECEAVGNPATEDMISWRREGFDLESRTKISHYEGKSYLTVYNISKKDVGAFFCVANNGIGQESVATAYMVLRTKPVIDNNVKYNRAASDEGNSGKLICQAKGAPDIEFSWSREGSTLDDNEKFKVESAQVDFNTWESVLTITDVSAALDYGDYLCVAKNEEGFSSAYIHFESTGKPDTPVSIKVINTTHNSVLLSWTPGFDGGLPQSFMVRYRRTGGGSGYMFSEVFPPNATLFVVSGLELGTEYEFSVMAMNEKGESAYTDDTVVAATSSIAPPGERQNVIPAVMGPKSKIPHLVIIIVSVVGAFLLVLNVFIVSCFIYRKRKKRLEEDDSDRSSSKAATVEMYSYANSNNGTVTGETLSSISEKSEQYSDEHSVDEYPEENGKAVSTYLTDGNNSNAYINNSSHYPYKDKDQGEYRIYCTSVLIPLMPLSSVPHSPKISNRSLLSDPDVVPHCQDENYADALRRNTFNMSINEKSVYGKTPVNYPPPPPSRTASSGAPPPEKFYNLTPPSDLTYPTYPNGSATMHQSPHRNPQYVSGEYRPPVLSTFSAPPHSPHSPISMMHPSTPTRTVPPELDGHLV
ncbi:Nephrin [Nymphon striatum]|nr:Nephrin [Nymphon striatum]KAG1691198.1 Nephrin [Nymphon striatum]KAG1691199.1 Nephrin [Nymphon striatum]